MSIILTSCFSSYKVPSKKYGDQLVSKKHNANGTSTNTFLRHGLTYIDKAKQKKLIERHVYDDGRLIYRYPILRSNVGASKIYLTSGNNFISKAKGDTIVFINNDLPTMNRHFWGNNITLSPLTDSSYILKTKAETGVAKFYVSASDIYEEIKNGNGFIADSLVITIR
jgi:hypothetical protein